MIEFLTSYFTRIDWARLFLPDTPFLELFLRGTLMYLGLMLLLRLVLKREAGGLALADLLVIVLLADAAQNGMADEYRSVTDGLLLVSTIIGWNYALNWLAYYFPAFDRLVNPPKLPLVRDGQMLRRNMRRELITEEELLSQVRGHGLARVEDVREAYMEPDGTISVVPRRGGEETNTEGLKRRRRL